MVRARLLFLAFGLVLAATSSAQAGNRAPAKPTPLTEESYINPPREVAEAALAPWYKNVSITNLSPDRKYYVVIDRDGMPTLDAMGKAHLNLGGFQVDTAGNRARELTTRSAKGFHFVELRSGKQIWVPLRPDARVTDVLWSVDSKRVAFLAHFLDRSEIWIANASDGKCKQVTAWPVLATGVTTLRWVADDQLVTVLVPKNRGGVPAAPEVAVTPKVKMSAGRTTSIRTYPSLLQNPFEAQQLEFYLTGQLALVDAASGKVKTIGKPAMIRSVNPSPDGKYFVVTATEKPFSYIFPTSNFPQREVIWDDKGEEKAQLSRRGMQGGDGPGGSGARGGAAARRLLEWRPDGRGLSFVQTQPAPAASVEELNIDDTDGVADQQSLDVDEQGRRGAGGGGFGGGGGQRGQGGPQGPQRPDEVMQWLPPFKSSDAHVIYTSTTRITSLIYSADMKSLYMDQTVNGRNRVSMVSVRNLLQKPVTIFETGPDDPAMSLSTKPGPVTGTVVRTTTDGKFGYLTGTRNPTDPMKEGPRPFVDKVDLSTGKRENAFLGRTDVFEQPTILDDDLQQILVVRQSAKMVPNTILLTPSTKDEMALTANKDYEPDLSQTRRETITITRQDGFKFECKVTFPRYFVNGAKMPAFFWFYPSEFVDQATYDRSKRTFNKNLFSQVGGANKAILTREGYVLVEPDCPIVGPADHKNDEYIPQLRNNLAAVIDELDKRGWIDRTRLGIGGHSYGAFSTANALVNTPFFKAGIAGDGNYNRTLTPFGFQTDDRELWNGRDFYLEMSPFLFAERMNGALLMYLGMEDQNVGTDPINSERMFDALESLGKTAAMYKYPYEDHGQVAKETILDQWARFVAWLDKYVKNAK